MKINQPIGMLLIVVISVVAAKYGENTTWIEAIGCMTCAILTWIMMLGFIPPSGRC